MARPARFTPDGILDAAALVVAQRWRDATVADVATQLGTPPNSVYYRFATKDALFGSLWLRSVRRFHVGLLEALAGSDPHEAAVAAAVHVPAFCRAHRLDAIAMTLYRQQDLAHTVSGQLAEDVAHVNDRVRDAMVELSRRRYGRTDEDTLALVAVACQENGYGLVRRYLRADLDMPPWLDQAVAAASAGILAIGDTPPLRAG
ncbi:TetR/AcrR family transcriptional regulator [Arsenicicoccus piscis]|uniref:Transcriptional regulator, TetR family protein n=1 Tax=Arsenicicoccus piscis TaxID=673954 RepID=A0ABQ6HL65_9MICO|nr:TetR/AcrR family transcriptional regulator [Arsenicicoccus piscis]MCH8627277.1 TetR/AcrR family transcriptional regulator [Arsenicicoccus piscis]GMA18737.1 putative transcriptional regulator, TetR family protein [Arsenicicoccus piscis]